MRLGALPDLDDTTRYQGLEYFTYSQSLPSGTTLAAAGSTTLSFNVDGESDFFWDKATCYVDAANDGTSYSAQLVPGILVTIIDTTSQRPLMNNPTPIANVFGTGQLPFILPIRKIFFSKATVKITLQNITDNHTYTRVDVAFIGIKAYLNKNG